MHHTENMLCSVLYMYNIEHRPQQVCGPQMTMKPPFLVKHETLFLSSEKTLLVLNNLNRALGCLDIKFQHLALYSLGTPLPLVILCFQGYNIVHFL